MSIDHIDDYSLRNIDASTLTTPEDCQEALLRLADMLAEMKSQIGDAKAKVIADDQYSDPKWFASVHAALRFAQATHQSVQMRLGVLNRERKAQRNRPLSSDERDIKDAERNVRRMDWNQKFHDACKAVLPANVFCDIEDAVRAGETLETNP